MTSAIKMNQIFENNKKEEDDEIICLDDDDDDNDTATSGHMTTTDSKKLGSKCYKFQCTIVIDEDESEDNRQQCEERLALEPFRKLSHTLIFGQNFGDTSDDMEFNGHLKLQELDKLLSDMFNTGKRSTTTLRYVLKFVLRVYHRLTLNYTNVSCFFKVIFLKQGI